MTRRLDERWLWLGDTRSMREAGLTVFQAHPGAWWMATGREMIGPLGDREILRAVRAAGTPTIDGCECGPAKLGVADLAPREPLRRGPRWREVTEKELPFSVTVYDERGLEPVSGCRTTFDQLPRVEWGEVEGWEPFVEERPACAGRLAMGWNAHPRGSLVFAPSRALERGFTIVDLARSGERPVPRTRVPGRRA